MLTALLDAARCQRITLGPHQLTGELVTGVQHETSISCQIYSNLRLTKLLGMHLHICQESI